MNENSSTPWVQIFIALLALVGVIIGVIYKYVGDQELAMIPIRATQAAEARGTENAAFATISATSNASSAIRVPTALPIAALPQLTTTPPPVSTSAVIPQSQAITAIPPTPSSQPTIVAPTIVPPTIAPIPDFVTLNWGPTACNSPDAVIVIGPCGAAQTRNLQWLATQLAYLKSAGVYPLGQMPDNFQFMLQPNPVPPYQKYWFLFIANANRVLLFNVTVGYYEAPNSLQIRPRDGTASLSAPLFLDKSERWWAQESNGRYHLLTK